ncbi:hypothetical+protein [Methylocapsa aurea]|uniref:methyltransferase domain-containing protein n=1 Tax=Methylocapsa aurea TaxID=663610 RepID=UPI003D18CA42
MIYDPTNRALYEALSLLVSDSLSLNSYIGPGPAFFQFKQLADALAEDGLTIEGRRCIEIGCGAARPYGIATLLHLCGAKSMVGIDDARSSDPGAVANTIALITLCAMLQPDHAGIDKLFSSHRDIMRYAGDFDLSELFKLNIDGAVPESIKIRHCRFEGLSPDEKKFDLAIASSVFEHVDDINGLMANLRENISNDGVIFAGLDYRDHRVYGAGGTSYWQYLVDDGGSPDINKIRHSELLDIFSKHGFSARVCNVDTSVPPSEERARFLPNYSHLSEDDIQTLGARIMLYPS